LCLLLIAQKNTQKRYTTAFSTLEVVAAISAGRHVVRVRERGPMLLGQDEVWPAWYERDRQICSAPELMCLRLLRLFSLLMHSPAIGFPATPRSRTQTEYLVERTPAWLRGSEAPAVRAHRRETLPQEARRQVERRKGATKNRRSAVRQTTRAPSDYQAAGMQGHSWARKQSTSTVVLG